MPELTIGGLTRTFTMRFPEERPAPLLLALHSNHPEATGQQMREWTAFDKQTDFAIAYPDGVGGCWADGRGVTTADEAGVDDVLALSLVEKNTRSSCGSSPTSQSPTENPAISSVAGAHHWAVSARSPSRTPDHPQLPAVEGQILDGKVRELDLVRDDLAVLQPVPALPCVLGTGEHAYDLVRAHGEPGWTTCPLFDPPCGLCIVGGRR